MTVNPPLPAQPLTVYFMQTYNRAVEVRPTVFLSWYLLRKSAHERPLV